MADLNRILFVQTADALRQQGETSRRLLVERLSADVDLAAAPQDVEPGTSYDAVIAPTVGWLPELLARLDGVQWVHFLSAGVEKIWEMEVDWQSLLLSKSSGVHAAPMSEYAIGAMLYFTKDFDRYVSQSTRREWSRTWLGELTGRRLLVLGMGSVGNAVAERGLAFGMKVTGVVRTPRSGQKSVPTHGLADLTELLPDTDFVVVTLPLTEETRGLVGAAFFEALKPGAVLVDMSRGGVVEADALIQALDRGSLRGAALDVFETEPLPPEAGLWDRPEVLITPHVSGTTPHYMERALEIFCQNAERYRAGEPLHTLVEVDRGY